MKHKAVFENPQSFIDTILRVAPHYERDTSEDRMSDSLIQLYERMKGFGQNLVRRTDKEIAKEPTKIARQFFERSFTGENLFEDRSEVWLKEYYTFIFNEKVETRSLVIIGYAHDTVEHPLFSISVDIDEQGEDTLNIHTNTGGYEDLVSRLVQQVMFLYFETTRNPQFK